MSEKEKPMKVIFKNKISSCPRCRITLGHYGKIRYCVVCGQRLDWSEIKR